MVVAAIFAPLMVCAVLVAVAGLWHGSNLAGRDPDEIAGLRTRPDIPVHSHSHHPGPERDPRLFNEDDELNQGVCEKDIDRSGRVSGARFVSHQENGVCSNTDLDVYSRDGKHYVVQGAKDAAYIHTEVTDPARPVKLKLYRWAGAANKYTRSMEMQAFAQGDRDYIALALERSSSSGYCGVVIVDVTNPLSPVKKSQYTGNGWCDTHNIFVEDDLEGDGRYIYATANSKDDMRVLDISGEHGGTVAAPREVGRYRSPTANPDNYVHDITVVDHGGSVGRRAYVAYWASGLVILDADDVTPGNNPVPLVGPNVIDPPGLLLHQAIPNAAGTRVIVQDEFAYRSTSRPVQMWDISGIPAVRPRYVDGLAPNVGVNGQLLPAHNMLVEGNRVYVGWYKAGMQGFLFNDAGFVRRFAYHQVQTEQPDAPYAGAWGVRTLEIGDAKYIFQSDRHYGLIVSRLDTTAPVVSAPAARLITTQALGTQNTPVELSWSASDDMSGVTSFLLQESVDGGPFMRVSLPSGTARSVVRLLPTNKSYRYRLRAADSAGNLSAWKLGSAFRVDRFEEGNAAVAYPAGTWTRQAISGASGGHVSYATQNGATARFSFTGKDVAWAGSKGPDRGRAEVYVDGAYLKTVELHAQTASTRQVLYARSWPVPGAHTLEIKVLGTAGRPRVDVDAFITLR